MILLLSIGFGLGVLAVVLADIADKRRLKPADEIRARVHRVIDGLTYQDSTLP